MTNKCPLCTSKSDFFHETDNKIYNKCSCCKAIFLLPEFYLSAEKEKKHYLKHNNDVFDVNYQKFVSPISDYVLSNRSINDEGLDFGAGTGPVISKLLSDKSFSIHQYDPFFHTQKDLLNNTYNYIVCCEVIEHFHFPYKEFELMHKLLRPGGDLLCMTEIYNETINFEKWYYKNDPTHVFIFQKASLEWIKDHFNFKELKISNRLILFSV